MKIRIRMKKVKLSLAAVISIIAGCFWGIISFFGFYFILNADTGSSLLYAFGACFIQWGFVFILKTIKRARRNFLRNALSELFFLTLFVCITSMFLIIPFAHYFTVYERKDQLKNKIETDLDNVVNMFGVYEQHVADRMRTYETKLDAAIIGKNLNRTAYLEAGFRENNESPLVQKNRFMQILEDNLSPARYDSLKLFAVNATQYYKRVVTNWVLPIRFLNIINNIEKEAGGWLLELKGYDESTTQAKGVPFDYPVSFASVKTELTQRDRPTLIAIIVATVLCVLLLFPYWFALRDPKNAGIWNELFSSSASHNEGGVIL